jgi:hypothetical protein
MGPTDLAFYVGLHQPSDARHFARSFISVNRLRKRKGPFVVGKWILDSGAFTEICTYGLWRTGVEDYAAEIKRWAGNGELLAAVAQDYMCEPFILAKTGLTIAEHQRLTIDRFLALRDACTGVYIMPVLQGFAPADYVRHIDMYGDALPPGAWVGVGSVCKRNGDARQIEAVLLAIKAARPDLRLHGFGLKTTALRSGLVRSLLFSADSMAWSYAARREKGNGNKWQDAEEFRSIIDDMPIQYQII